MLEQKGFRINIGKGTDYMVIENVDKSDHVSIIEHDSSTIYNLPDADFIMLAERLYKEAQKIKERKSAESDIKISFSEEPGLEEND